MNKKIESAHPTFNELLSRFGATRGSHLKEMVFQKILFERSSFLLENINLMIAGTTRKKGLMLKSKLTSLQPVALSEEVDCCILLHWTKKEIQQGKRKSRLKRNYYSRRWSCKLMQTPTSTSKQMKPQRRLLCVVCAERGYLQCVKIYTHMSTTQMQ